MVIKKAMQQQHKKLVSDFMVAGKQPIREKLYILDRDLREFRKNLIAEELRETKEAIAEKSKLKLLDGICDSLYVLHGALLSFGIEIDSKHHYKLAEDEILLKHFTETELAEIRKTNPETLRVSETATWYVSDHRYLKPEAENWWKLTAEMLHFNEILLNHLNAHYQLLETSTDPDANLISKATRGIEHALILGIGNLYRMSETLDFKIDQAFRIVHSCNMSKFCTTKTDAEESVRQYADKPEPVQTEFAESELDGVKIYIIKNSKTGKVLKSHLWTPPEAQLSELLEPKQEPPKETTATPEPEPKPEMKKKPELVPEPKKKPAKKSKSKSDDSSESEPESPKTKTKAKTKPKTKKRNSDSDSD